MLSLFISDILANGCWRELGDLGSEQHGGIVELLFSSRAASTVAKYTRTYGRWKQWAQEQEFPNFPAQPLHLALYLEHLARCTRYKASVEEAANALAWVRGRRVGESILPSGSAGNPGGSSSYPRKTKGEKGALDG